MVNHSIRSNYLSKQTTNCMKFICSIAVVICHLFGYDPFGEGMGIGVIITAFGYLSVSCFLFFSGYGLTVSYIKKGNEYFKGYIKKRVLPIYIIQVILIVIYSIFRLLVEEKLNLRRLTLSFFFGDTIIEYGWYIQMILLFYLIYYLAFNKQSIKSGIIRLAFALLLYCFACKMLDLATNWYEASWTFLLGVIWAYRKQEIDKKLSESKNYILSLIFACLGFAFTFILGNGKFLSNIPKVSFKMISSVMFVILVLLIVMKIKIDYKPIVYAGNFYFEIYFIQGIFIILFNKFFIIENMLLRYAICISFICITAAFVNPAVMWIVNKCKDGK